KESSSTPPLISPMAYYDQSSIPYGLEEEIPDENTSRVVVTVSARGLRDCDIDSVSDPFCVVSSTQAGMIRSRKWKEAGRTETINNTLDPDWATKIQLEYNFGEQQRLLFEVFDKGNKGKHTRLGQATILLHEIIGAKYNRVTVPLSEDGKQYGSITISAEEQSKGRQESLYFICSASNVDRKDFLGKCDPFLKISRINYDNTLQLAYRTRYKEQNLNPKWKPIEIHLGQLCYGEKNRQFLIECFDWDQDGNHELVGSCVTTVDRLVHKVDRDLPLINEKKARKNKKYENSGILHFHKVYCWMDYTFLDFISTGTELDFTVAIDFTKSNLPLEDDSSLHRVEIDGSANQYEIAIESIAEICQHYNTSKVFNAFGFGAKLPPTNKVHFNFPLNVESGDPRCEGIQGLLHAYHVAQQHVELSGPTDFSPTIRFAARRAAALPTDGSKYLVLLIITDGVISDMAKTKEEIVKASVLPLSIIIVGVGYDSFEEMKVLDSDNIMLSANGKFAKRDIVQFVEMRKFLPPHRQLTAQEIHEAKRILAKEVLQEIPGQLTSYMKSKGVFPQQHTSPQREQQRQMYLNSPMNGMSPMTTPRGCSALPSPLMHSDSGRRRRMLPQIPIEETRQLQIS
ncbi:nra-1, partial [Pristionchus pacificus]|uniref:Nra-1 n=1 Tax=Pristionchus pacificus TaxID=54126 RepID=A0A2A6D179_PRIPA